MNTDAKTQLLSFPMSDLKTFYSSEKMKGHRCNLSSMSVIIPYWQTTHNHVSISNSLNFIHIIVWDDGVTASVKVIQQVHNLQQLTMTLFYFCFS